MTGEGVSNADANAVDYETSIPNNVGLSSDRRVLKVLESGILVFELVTRWARGLQDLVYLRTWGVEPGWAKFDYVRMPEYRWGVLAPKKKTD